MSSPSPTNPDSNDCPTSRVTRPPSTRITHSDVDAPTANFLVKPRLSSQILVPPLRVVDDASEPLSERQNTSIQPVDPLDATKIADAFLAMPQPGEMAYGFQIVREIGKGAFGRVFLATQGNLAGRLVVLKVSADLVGESRALAKLQHTNIVPVYSVHKSGPLQAVCMPYFGTTTLQNILRKFRETDSVPQTGKDFVDTFRYLNANTQTESDAMPIERLPEPSTDAVFALLAASSYVRAVVWLAVRLTDGMAHAHDRGIIHRDIKPANILLTDDCQPMLLDFGVSEELVLRASVASATLGGTLAYMAPEHLQEVLTAVASADSRSDIYSLGIVLYELLTGRYPFRMPTESSKEEVEKLIFERQFSPIAPMRSFNRDVSPGLESIVLKCLAFEPSARYQSAGDLREDLNRYLTDQPLKFAQERSLREVAQKWAKRHPHMTSTTMLGSLLAIVMLVVGAAFWANSSRLARLEAEQTYREFQTEASDARQLLYWDQSNHTAIDAGVAKAEAAIARYRAEKPNWDGQSNVSRLPPEQQQDLRQELVDLYLMLARGLWHQATRTIPPNPELVERTLALNTLAGELAGDHPPRMLYWQRTVIFKKLGRDADLAKATADLAKTPPLTARDHYHIGVTELDAGRHAEAIKALQKAQTLDTKAVWAYYAEGVAHYSLGQWAAARGCFTSVLALDSKAPFAQYNRGAAVLKLGDAAAAVKDMDAVIESQPHFADAYIVRAEAREQLEDYTAALADADKAIGLGANHPRVLPLRSRLRKLTGDAFGANADHFNPDNVDGWIHRGLDKLATDKAGALQAFEKAIALDPKHANARMYQAHVFGETGRETECVASLSIVMQLDPKNVAAVASRGVMQGRLGKYKAALADARAALDLGFSPLTAYQVACIYAYASKEDPAYKAEAFTLLGIALRGGFGHDFLDADRDLEAIRGTPEFDALQAKARRERPQVKP